MTLTEPVETFYLPADRAVPEEVARQAAYFAGPSLMSQMLNALPVVVMILNQQRQLVYTNHPLILTNDETDRELMIGLRPGETFNCIHAFEHRGGCGTTQFCQECGAAKAIQSSLLGRQAIEECRILREQDGQMEALDLRVWTSPFEYNSETFLIFTLLDISSEKRRLALERIFFHDISNLIGVILPSIQLMREVNAPKDAELLDIVEDAAHRLAEEVASQRELLAAENHELSVHPVPLKSIDFLQGMVDTYARHPAAEKRSLFISPGAARITFTSDPVLLGRVTGNMIKNALEASAPGETVTLDCQLENDETISFAVHNPAYMPEEVQRQIFQRSFSTKGRGRGLGTYSMRLLSENYLQGQVSFQSSLSEGTTFTGRYPRQLEG